MTLRLVKTVGGSNGSPHTCMKCGASHFIASGEAWHCSTCGLYVPTMLALKKDIANALDALGRLKQAAKVLEKLIEE